VASLIESGADLLIRQANLAQLDRLCRSILAERLQLPARFIDRDKCSEQELEIC
jgi:hypothetical protein